MSEPTILPARKHEEDESGSLMLSGDWQPINIPNWVEVRFAPPLNMHLHECLPEVVALFEKHYDLREEDGMKVFSVYSKNGGALMRECAIFIKQRSGGRAVPVLAEGQKYIA